MPQRISTLKKIMVVVAVVLLLPSMLASFNGNVPACEPPYCPNPCPAGYTDCTYDWVMESPTNFAFAMYLMSMGYTIIVCCN